MNNQILFRTCKSFLQALDKNIKGPSSILSGSPGLIAKKVAISVITFCSEYLPQGRIHPCIEWRHYFRGHMPRSSLFVMCSLLSSILSPKHFFIFPVALVQPEFQNILQKNLKPVSFFIYANEAHPGFLEFQHHSLSATNVLSRGYDWTQH